MDALPPRRKVYLKRGRTSINIWEKERGSAHLDREELLPKGGRQPLS